MDIVSLLDRMQHIARNGLTYAQNSYDRERYEQLLALTTHQYSEFLDQPPEEVQTAFTAELGHITPKVGADAAIFNDIVTTQVPGTLLRGG